MPASRLPRSLGVAATLNEVTFVSSPVIAAALGGISPQLAAWAMVLLGAVPIALLPQIPSATAPGPEQRSAALRLTPMIVLWLVCGGASSAAISAIEIGSVSLAVSFGMPAAWGALFPVAICVTSILGGVWVSVHNREPRRRTVLAWLGVTALGVVVVGFGHSAAATVIGALLVGAVLAPLSTYYSLVLDRLVAPEHRAEVFALLRTAIADHHLLGADLAGLPAGDLHRGDHGDDRRAGGDRGRSPPPGSRSDAAAWPAWPRRRGRTGTLSVPHRPAATAARRSVSTKGRPAARTDAQRRAVPPDAPFCRRSQPSPWPSGNASPVPSAAGIATGSLPRAATVPASTPARARSEASALP